MMSLRPFIMPTNIHQRFAATLSPRLSNGMASSHVASTNLRTPFTSRAYSSDAAPEQPGDLTEGESKAFQKLKEGLEPTKLIVKDISGGCGSMYAVNVVSPKFEGLSVVKQHKLVNQVLADDIKQWHGIQLTTKAP